MDLDWEILEHAKSVQPSEPQALVGVTGSVVMKEEDFVSVWLALPHIRRLMASLVYLIFGLSLVGWSGVFDEKHRYAISVIVALLGVALLVFGSNRVRADFARRSLAEMGAQGHADFNFDAGGFGVRIGMREVQFDWGDALLFAETRDSFVIYTEPRAFLVVPKRSFEPYKLPDLRRLLAELIPRGRSGLVGDWRQSLVKSMVFLAALWGLARILSF